MNTKRGSEQNEQPTGFLQKNPMERRRATGLSFVESVVQDVRFAFRQLAKSPGFTLVAIATMALGIGANTAIFSVVNVLLLRPLPYPDSDRIVAVGEMTQNGGFAGADGGGFSGWEDATTQLESVAAVHRTDKNLTGDGDPVRVSGLEVSGKYLHVLRLNPALGRMEEKGWTPGGMGKPENNHHAKFFKLTHAGSRQLEEKLLLGAELPSYHADVGNLLEKIPNNTNGKKVDFN